MKGAVATISLFRKDVKNFFRGTRTPATIETLVEFGFSEEYLDYDISTKRNVGSATVTGVEFGYRQSLGPLVEWAKPVQLFANVTLNDLSGPNATDFSGFSPRTIQWGVSYTRPKYSARINVNTTGWRRFGAANASATVRPNSYSYWAPWTKVDATVSYMFSKRYGLYADVRNLFGTPLTRGTWSPDTPEFARRDQFNFTGASWTLGIKGDF